MQSWPEHVLNLINTTATVTSFLGGLLVLISIGFVYLSGTELTRRAREENRVPGQQPTRTSRLAKVESELAVTRKSEKEKASRLSKAEADLAKVRKSEDTKTSRLSQLETDLAAVQKSERDKTSRLSKTEAELAKIRTSEEAKTLRLSQTEGDLATTQKSEKEKASRLSQSEVELTAVRRTEEEKALRVAQLEAELLLAKKSNEETAAKLTKAENELAAARQSTAAAKQSAEEAKAAANKLESKQRPRTIGREQRNQFLEATRGLPKGKVIASAIFFNKETHDLSADILNLLKEAGFEVIEPAPMNFFTTSRPESGIRIGFKSEASEPPHVATLQKAFRAIGLDPPTTTLVNSDADDVVEIQVTPKE
jgi:hypothetical protein